MKLSNSSHLDGLRGEARFIDFAARNGWHIYRGLDGHERCDYIVEMGDRVLARVEVKWIAALFVSERNYYYVTVTKMRSDVFDFLFVVTPDASYWIPASAAPSRTLSIKQVGGVYQRNITRPGKYEVYRVESF